jgi:cytochrome o ubiquinol oxidase subunit 2
VFILTGWISWRYKEGHKGKYEPEWDKNSLIEWVWWGVPFIIIAILGWITWTSSHELDPYKPLEHEKKPMTIQVVALQWKWLFLYPEQKIATVNYVQFPEKTPISFDITADAPMNSFWIPQLGSQIYAMPGMKTKLQLIADESGEFRGSSSNISGQGFSGMTFMAKASSQEEFDAWAESVSKSPQVLSWEEYQELVKPTSYVPPACYALKDTGLYEQIVMKYMAPSMEREKEKP